MRHYVYMYNMYNPFYQATSDDHEWLGDRQVTRYRRAIFFFLFLYARSYIIETLRSYEAVDS